MIYTYSKQLLLILFVLILAIGGFVFYKINTSHTKDTAGQIPTVVKPVASIPLSKVSIEEINANMTKLLTMKYGQAVATAHIREGSYERTMTSSQTITIRVLIDVPEKKETYLYTSTGTSANPNITAQIHCAAEADQMVHPSTCQELSND